MSSERERMEFAKRLNRLLDEAAFPPKNKGRQVDLAKLLGVSQNAAHKWLDGQSIPRQATLQQIAGSFGCSSQWLRYGENGVSEESAEYGAENGVQIVHAIAGPDSVPVMLRDLQEADIAPHRASLVRVSGDSMEPTLRDGDAMIVDRDRRALEDGRLFVFRTKQGYRVRRVSMNASGGVTLASDNSRYPPETLNDSDAGSLPVIGMVALIYGKR